MLNSLVSFVTHYFLVVLFIFLHEFLLDALDLLFGQHSSLDAFLGVFLEHWWVCLYLLVHLGLCEKGLVLLVVSESSVTDDIDENVLFELLSVLYSNLHATVQKVRFISIDMNDWCSNNLSYLCAVVRWSSLPRVCCKSYLIIHNNMDDASCCIVNEILQL